MLKHNINSLLKNEPLTQQQASTMVQRMLQPNTAPEQIAACMVLLHLQRHNVNMLTGIATTMRQQMITIPTAQPVLDIVGTGGDNAQTVNISTGSALLLAACGVKVAKHGNRAVSSCCGAADVLEALHIPITLSASTIASQLKQYNFGFCFAPNFHPALMKLRAIRKALAVPTVFNLMGPLLNPANAEYLMIGVYQPELMTLFSQVLVQLNIKKALVFHSQGLDELTCAAPAQAMLIENHHIRSLTLDAVHYGLPRCPLQPLIGGDANTNAELLLQAFNQQHPAIANTLIFNAGIGLYLYQSTHSIQAGIELAKTTLHSGAVIKLIAQLRETHA